jgi:hypothetical protein
MCSSWPQIDGLPASFDVGTDMRALADAVVVLQAVDGAAGPVQLAMDAHALPVGESTVVASPIAANFAADPMVAPLETPCLAAGELAGANALVDPRLLVAESLVRVGRRCSHRRRNNYAQEDGGSENFSDQRFHCLFPQKSCALHRARLVNVVCRCMRVTSSIAADAAANVPA